MVLPSLSSGMDGLGWITRKGREKMAKQYRDAKSGQVVTVVARLNACGVKVRDEDGSEYVTCFCGLLA